MARLGRQRRSGAKVARGRSITTPTPLVRKRLVMEMDGTNGAWRWYSRIKRGRRPAARIIRARSTPTPTPLVRKRVFVSVNSNDRAHLRRYRFRRRVDIVLRSFVAPFPPRRVVQTPTGNDRAHRARFFYRRRPKLALRAPRISPVEVVRVRPALVSRAVVRAARVRALAGRGVRLARGVSTVTPTPLIKPTVVLGRGRNRAARARSFFARPPGAQLSRPPIVAAAPLVVVRVLQPVVNRTLRALRVRATSRHRVRVTRSIVQPYRTRPAIVGRSRARQRVRFSHQRGVLVLRSRSQLATQTTVPKLVLARGRRRQALARGYYLRRRTHLETSTLGTAAGFVIGPPITTVTRATGASGRTLVATGSGRTRAAGGTGRTIAGPDAGETFADGGSGDTQSSLGGS